MQRYYNIQWLEKNVVRLLIILNVTIVLYPSIKSPFLQIITDLNVLYIFLFHDIWFQFNNFFFSHGFLRQSVSIS